MSIRNYYDKTVTFASSGTSGGWSPTPVISSNGPYDCHMRRLKANEMINFENTTYREVNRIYMDVVSDFTPTREMKATIDSVVYNVLAVNKPTKAKFLQIDAERFE